MGLLANNFRPDIVYIFELVVPRLIDRFSRGAKGTRHPDVDQLEAQLEKEKEILGKGF